MNTQTKKNMPQTKMYPMVHKKTGNVYFVVAEIIDCTNASNDRPMILYVNTEGMLFCREKNEFFEKFMSVLDCKLRV